MSREIIEIGYNYRQACSDGKEVFCEDWNEAKIGIKGVVKITENDPAMDGGEKHYFDIHFDDGTKKRVFNPNYAKYSV